MTPRTRSQDLTADLLHDLEVEEAAPAVLAPPIAGTAPPRPGSGSDAGPGEPAPGSAPGRALTGPEPVPFVETSLYLDPRGWRRPQLSRAGGSLRASFGPLRLRIGGRES
jgi:hypothetical protein